MCAISLDSAYRWCHPCLSLIYFTQYDSLYYRPLFNWPEIKIANKNISKILRGVNLEGQNNSVFKGYLRCLSGKESSCQCKETQEMWVWSLGWEDPLEEEMAPHSSILAWEIPWTEEPGGLQSTGWQRVGHSWATNSFQDCYWMELETMACPWPSSRLRWFLKGLEMLWRRSASSLSSPQGTWEGRRKKEGDGGDWPLERCPASLF